jgi:SAM-dependent methyltransferase
MTAASGAPADAMGAETLDIMHEAPAYNRWQYSRIAPFLGRRICEIGSGIGNMSDYLLQAPYETVVLTDMDSAYLDMLRARFGARPNVHLERLMLPDPTAGPRFAGYALDTVVALNVVEHIPDDLGALASAASLLQPGGRLVILVPAFQRLFGSLDETLGHVRRYTRRTISERFRSLGLEVEQTFYFNLVGTLGWWFNARVRRVPLIPRDQLRRFDALVPFLRLEDQVPLPFGQSVICIGRVPVGWRAP